EPIHLDHPRPPCLVVSGYEGTAVPNNGGTTHGTGQYDGGFFFCTVKA
ncbi:MAG: hypothetical protein RLZZ526_1652, partial [Actinomycetota bacterium]